MLDRKRERWTNNYTYFFGGLTEEEQMYRDYFETDLEEDPEDDYFDDKWDERHIYETGDFDQKRFDFIENTHSFEPQESYTDLVEDKIFKFKYRQGNDGTEKYERRQERLITRQLERA